MVDGTKRKSENLHIISSRSIVGTFVWFSHEVIKTTAFLYCIATLKINYLILVLVNFTVLCVTDYFKCLNKLCTPSKEYYLFS